MFAGSPLRVNSQQVTMPYRRVSHKSHSTTLRGRAKKRSLDFALLQICCISFHIFPSDIFQALLVIFGWSENYVVIIIDLYTSVGSHLKDREVRRPENPVWISEAPFRLGAVSSNLTHLRAMDSACSSRVRVFHSDSPESSASPFSGSATGMISKSCHRREQIWGKLRAKKDGMAIASIFSMRCSQ